MDMLDEPNIEMLDEPSMDILDGPAMDIFIFDEPSMGILAIYRRGSYAWLTVTIGCVDPADPETANDSITAAGCGGGGSDTGVGIGGSDTPVVPKDMTAVNATIHHHSTTNHCTTSTSPSTLRLPLHPYGGSHAVFMYSTAADGNVTLQLKEPDDLDRGSLAAMLARLQDDASTFSISYQDSTVTDILSEGGIDVLLGEHESSGGGGTSGGDVISSGTATIVNSSIYDPFDSSSGPDLTLSPQTFTNNAEGLLNDNSNSLGGSAPDLETGSEGIITDEKKIHSPTGDVGKLSGKRQRPPRATSPNKQGPQQCQTCAKIFGNASALAKHKLTHSDERKYVCTMCGKAFKRQDHLNGHMLTHRNKKPYECKAEGCGKSYCDARSLRRHTENHHSTHHQNSSIHNSNHTNNNVILMSNNSSDGTSLPTVSATTTMSPAQGAATGDAASPHGSSCIQYAAPSSISSPSNSPLNTSSSSSSSSSSPSTTTTSSMILTTSHSHQQIVGKTTSLGNKISTAQVKSGLCLGDSLVDVKGGRGGLRVVGSELAGGYQVVEGRSQLQQLLASEPAGKSGCGPNNDGLTKQQLDLIHQIMEQTQRQSQQTVTKAQTTSSGKHKNANSKDGNNGGNVQVSGTKVNKRAWSSVSAAAHVTGVNAQATSGGLVSTSQQNSSIPTSKPHLTLSPTLNSNQSKPSNQTKSNSSPKTAVDQLTTSSIITSSSTTNQSSSSTSTTYTNTSLTSALSVSTASNITTSVTSVSGGVSVKGSLGVDQKPVECNLCHRKFKNVPALNGHMRLHGGYFKKDTENKKCEKKDSVGPPLQTASISVRALIEEKIINKRSVNTSTQAQQINSSTNVAATTEESSTAPPLFPLTVHSSASSNDLDTKIMSFVVPALPPLTPPVVTMAPSTPQQPNQDSKTTCQQQRKHSVSSEAFTVPRPITTSFTNQQQHDVDALADLILKRDKVTVKRTVSDPGQQIIQFQNGESFTLAYQSDDGYLSPSLQDDVFTQVPDNLLLQGVDAQHLASIQFEDSILHEQGDHHLQDIQLDDYELQENVVDCSHSVNQELQAVLDSPLPEGLAEFSAYHSSTTNLGIQTHSPGGRQFNPHITLVTQSPLQSPLIKHDSPGFAYPTPPASHEGQSPCFGQNTMMPLVSPKQEFMVSPKQEYSMVSPKQEFMVSPKHEFLPSPKQEFMLSCSDLDEPPQASSPLSAAFFTSTMSSSAAVEEALEEVLPGESIAADELYPSLTNSPISSVGLTPVQSPLSTITTTSSVTSQTTFANTSPTNQMSSPNNQFSVSPHYMLQSQMMPNSDDPLLSSSPKDFPTRKKFEFNGLPLKVISTNNGLIDLNSSNFTGILVESNGEIKFIQTGGAQFNAKNIVLTQMMTPSSLANLVKVEDDCSTSSIRTSGNPKTILRTVTCSVPTKPMNSQGPKYSNPFVEAVKIEDLQQHNVFLSPTTIPANPVRTGRKRPRVEPLQMPVFHHSRLRATRSKPPGAAPYTPLPILNPNRNGPGLYWPMKQKQLIENIGNWSNEFIPESDSIPHINIGNKFQCVIPPSKNSSAYNRMNQERNHEDLLWDPGITTLTDSEVDMYLAFACCAAVPGGGRNQEYAMHILYMCGGNFHEAMLKLMQPTPVLPSDHPLLCYQYSETDKWTTTETEAFHQALLRYDKDFFHIAKDVGTKTVKQCVQFYYMWKKVCNDEYKRLKLLRERRNGSLKVNDASEEKPYADAKLLGVRKIADTCSPILPTMIHIPEQQRNFNCEFSECSARFNSRAALNGHIRIHGGTSAMLAANQQQLATQQRQSPSTIERRLNGAIANTTNACVLTTTANASLATTTSCSNNLTLNAALLASTSTSSVVASSGVRHNIHHQHHNIHHHNNIHTTTTTNNEDYPCKICGKVFGKIKSRSAHMKSHRPPDAEPSAKRKERLESLLSATSALEATTSVPSSLAT